MTTDLTEIKRIKVYSDLHTNKYNNLDEIPRNTPKVSGPDALLLNSTNI